MCRILSLAPLDPIDLLLDLERFEIIEFRFVRLELCIEFVLAALFLQRDVIVKSTPLQ